MILLDTNILARVIQKGDRHQQPAIDALAELRLNMREVLVIVPQVLIEFYAICTRSNRNLGLPADEAIVQISHWKQEYPLLPESPAIFSQWELLMQKYKPTNRQVYDLRLVASMLANNIPTILSFNDADFVGYPEIRALNPFDLLKIPRV